MQLDDLDRWYADLPGIAGANTWHVLKSELQALLAQQRAKDWAAIGEPNLGDFAIQPDSYEDVVKVIQWYKERLESVLGGKLV